MISEAPRTALDTKVIDKWSFARVEKLSIDNLEKLPQVDLMWIDINLTTIEGKEFKLKHLLEHHGSDDPQSRIYIFSHENKDIVMQLKDQLRSITGGITPDESSIIMMGEVKLTPIVVSQLAHKYRQLLNPSHIDASVAYLREGSKITKQSLGIPQNKGKIRHI